MQKLQQYCVGRLAGSLEQQPAPISRNPVSEESEGLRSAVSRMVGLGFARWMKVVVTVFAISIVVVLCYCRGDGLLGYLSLAPSVFHLRLGDTSEQDMGYAFWVGVVVALSFCGVGFGYLYRLFLSTLDYQNDVFSLPATIPRKMKR